MTAEATPSLVEATDGPAQAGPSVRGPRARTTTAYLRTRGGQVGGGAAVSLLAVLVTSFFLFRLIPGDPVKYMTGGRQVSAGQLAHYRVEFGLDLPLAAAVHRLLRQGPHRRPGHLVPVPGPRS